MAADERVAAARAHWGPRFVANGLPAEEVEQTLAGIGRWQEWCAAFSRRGAHHERLAEAAEAHAAALTAAQCRTRAGVWYHFAKFLFVHAPEEMRTAHQAAVGCRTRALPDLPHPGERVEIPFDNGVLAANLRRPAGVQRPPVVVMAMGLDSAKEEMDANEQAFLDRGVATLALDGPGQGEAEYRLAIRPDFEAPVGAVLDWLHDQRGREVDAGRVGLWGVSLGGYYAPRAAAFEERIRCCVALAGPYDFGAAWDGLPALTREAFRVRSHLPEEEAARAHAQTLSLRGAAERITCPLLAVFGEQDRLFPLDGARRLVEESCGPAELWTIPGGNHVAANRWYEYRAQSADWVARHLEG